MEFLENTQVEFKREYTDMVKKEVVAFANTQGGTIYIGIDDGGQVVGLSDPDKTLLQVANMLHNSVRPDLTLFSQCSLEELEGKSIIKIVVQRGTGRPYYITEKGLKPAGVYVRVGSASMPVSSEVIREMIKESDGECFESSRALKQDLTFAFLQKEFLGAGMCLDNEAIRSLGLIGEDGLYTNLALLLSDQCGHSMKVAVFRGRDKNDLLERYECVGSLLEQYREASALVRRLEAKGYHAFPETGLRESLLNAVVHRDYALSGSTLLSFFGDRLEIVSLGGLVQGLSPQDLPLGVSLTRNERLSRVFYRLRLVDTYGAGIVRINDSYRGLGCEPEFITTEHVFVTVLPNLSKGRIQKHVPLQELPRYVTIGRPAQRKKKHPSLPGVTTALPRAERRVERRRSPRQTLKDRFQGLLRGVRQLIARDGEDDR